MANHCNIVDEGDEYDYFRREVIEYTKSENKIQSTQKPLDSEYKETEFWERINNFLLLRVKLDKSIIAKATRNLFWGLVSNRDKSSILHYAARLSCYIAAYNDIDSYMLDIKQPEEPVNHPGRQEQASIEDRTRQPTQEESDDESEEPIQEQTGTNTSDATAIDDTTTSSNITLDDNKWFIDTKPEGEGNRTKVWQRLKDASQDDLCIWGPWFALLVIRLEKRSAEHLISKVESLNSNLTKLYTISSWSPINLDGFSSFKTNLEGFNGITLMIILSLLYFYL